MSSMKSEQTGVPDKDQTSFGDGDPALPWNVRYTLGRNSTPQGYLLGPDVNPTAVFDNMIHNREMPVTIGLFVNPGDREAGHPVCPSGGPPCLPPGPARVSPTQPGLPRAGRAATASPHRCAPRGPGSGRAGSAGQRPRRAGPRTGQRPASSRHRPPAGGCRRPTSSEGAPGAAERAQYRRC